MKAVRYIAVLLFLTNCTVTKDVAKSSKETDRTIKEYSQTITKKPKDSVIYVPNYHFKDTTIVKEGKRTTLRVNYNSQGQISQADCISNEIYQLQNTIREIKESIDEKNKEKTKQTTVSPLLMLYAFLGLAVLMVVFKLINKFL